ncbi:MAG: NAD(P)H-dependent oxidoreductase [Pseudomonadales bacterium]
MKHLLIVYHSKTGNTRKLVEAAQAGARDPQLDDLELRCLTAAQAGPQDLLWADGIILATPENFGYMSGAMKDFFDRTFYEVEGRLNPLPYVLLVSAGNDGSGAVRSIERIVNGYPLSKVAEPIVVKGAVAQDNLDACYEAAMTLAAGLALGMF